MYVIFRNGCHINYNPTLTRPSIHPFQVCTAVTGPRLPTARWLAGESSAPWAQSMRSWRVWLRSAAPSLSLRNPCGSAFWAARTLRLHLRRKPRILPRWTVPSCTAVPRLTPHSAGTPWWTPGIRCDVFRGRVQVVVKRVSCYNPECALLWQGHVSGDQHQLGQPDVAGLWPALWVQPSGDGAHQLPGWRQRALPAGLQGPRLLHQLQQQVRLRDTHQG